MVRLIVIDFWVTISPTSLFQFQNGAINSCMVFSEPFRTHQFQFQNGAINRFEMTEAEFVNHVFQFQNGAINRTNIKRSD